MPGLGPRTIGDRLVYVTPDGKEYQLHLPEKGWVLQEDGFGMPPIEYVTERGPFQHGETVKDFFLKPRTIQLIIRREGCSRADYWAMRNEMLDMLRPGRPGIAPTPGILRKYLIDGKVREFDAFISQGPSFPPHDGGMWDEFSINDTIRFTCYNPIGRDPKLKSTTFTSSGAGLTFPITFPITFGSIGGATGATITYNGTWISYPKIILRGPLAGPVVRNLTTGELVQLNTTVPTGRTVTIDLTYGSKTVVLDDGTNYLGFVSSDSNVDSFHLQPGTNVLQVYATGTSAISSFTLEWYERFLGI